MKKFVLLSPCKNYVVEVGEESLNKDRYKGYTIEKVLNEPTWQEEWEDD